jgi:hypothetical protein
MASLEGIPFFNSTGTLAESGGAFVLSQPSPIRCVLPLTGGWVAELREGSRSIVVRGGVVNDYTQARSHAVSKAQQALDWLSIHRVVDLDMHHIDEDHIVWWTKQKRIVLRMTCIETEVAGRIAVRAVEDLNPLSQLTEQLIDWHPSYRYFRLAQTTDDTFDAFRNLYLALESLLEQILPVQKTSAGKPVPKRARLKAALAMVAQRINLGPYPRPGTGKPENRIFNEIYTARRNPVFHAKSTRRPSSRVNMEIEQTWQRVQGASRGSISRSPRSIWGFVDPKVMGFSTSCCNG